MSLGPRTRAAATAVLVAMLACALCAGPASAEPPSPPTYVAAAVNYRPLTRRDVAAAWRAYLSRTYSEGDALQRELDAVLADHDRVASGKPIPTAKAARYRSFLHGVALEVFLRQIEEDLARRRKGVEPDAPGGDPDPAGTGLAGRERAAVAQAAAAMAFHTSVGPGEVSPADVRAYYEAHRGDYTHSEKTRVRQIVVLLANHADEKRCRARAAELLGRLKAGADFAALARASSEGPRSAEGGLWDPVGRGSLLPPVDAFVWTHGVGARSGLIRTDLGYHIVRVEAKTPGVVVPFEAARLAIAKRLLRDRFRERLRAWLRQGPEHLHVWTMFDRGLPAERDEK